MTDRVVIEYGGAQIIDARTGIRVRFFDPAPAGLKASLRKAGWHRIDSIQWQREHSPATIASARTILGEHFGEPQ